MNRFNQTKWLLVLILIGLFLFSCQKEDLEFTNKEVTNSIVPIELAKKVAQNYAYDEVFYHHQDKNRKNRSFRTNQFVSKKEIRETLVIKDKDEIPALYIVEFKEGGFVIVSANKKETPILAFSETGNFEYNSDINNKGLKNWIENRTKRIFELRTSNNVNISDDISHEWIVFGAPPIDDEIIVSGGTIYEQEGPLLSTTWNQGCGYNELSPYACSMPQACGKVWTGCVATATAQIMKYWEYPNSYDWSIMPDNTGSYETSRLMRDIGDAVDMNWGCETGSGTPTSNARDALVNTFGYSNYASFEDFNKNKVVSELKYHRPFILRGSASSNSGGHAWVCDGYKRNKYIWIHNPGTWYEYETYTFSSLYLWMNWGWGQFGGNAWFLYNDFTPESDNFNFDNEMIINIHP